jgi:hypothetical protein
MARFKIDGKYVTERAFNAYIKAAYDREYPKPPKPTYEQAVVHMFRTAKGIVNVGKDLKVQLDVTREHYTRCSWHLGNARRNRKPNATALERELCKILDKLWLAQGKYEAWAKTYGDI